MRSRDDLAAAFALIEASLDEHCAQAGAEPDHVVQLRSGARRRTAHRRRVVTVVASIAAAASAAALVVAFAVGGFSGPQPSLHSDAPPALGVEGRSLPFVLAPTSGLQVIGVISSATGRTVELAGRTAHLSVHFAEPDRDVQVSRGLEAVTLGDRHGFYDDGSGPALTQISGSESTVGTPGFDSERAVVWQYAPHAYAVLTGFENDYPPPSRAVLLQAARDLRTTGSTPVQVSFRLAPDPALGALVSIDTTLREVTTTQPPYTFRTGATLCQVDYQLPATGNGIEVTVEHADPAFNGGIGSGVAVRVDGHDARWDVRFHQLAVGLGNGVVVLIVEANLTGRYTLGVSQLEQVFRLITVAPDVADPSTWTPAQQALP